MRRQIDKNKNKTKQVRIGIKMHTRLKIRAAELGKSIRSVVEGFSADGLGTVRENKDYE